MKIKGYQMIFLFILFASIGHAGQDVYERMPPLKMDRLMAVKDAKVGDVLFRHETHTAVLECRDCHPKVFLAQKNVNATTMDEMRMGYGCGACHGKDAFGLDDCNKCHNVIYPVK